MAHRKHGNAFDDAMELLIENGFDGMADVLRILLNEAMKIEREGALAAGVRIRELLIVRDMPTALSPRLSIHAWAGSLSMFRR